MFNKNSIKNRVMKIVNQKIEEAQKGYDIRVKELEEERKDSVERINELIDEKVEKAADYAVQSIVGNIF